MDAATCGGAAVVADRPVGAPAAGVLLGELRRHGVGVVGVQQLQALRDAPVQQPAPGRAHVRVGGVAEQVVGEVVAATDLAQDAAAPQLVDRADHGVGGEVGGLGEQVEGDVATDGGGEPGDLAGLLAHLRQPGAQHRRQLVACAATPRSPARPASTM